MEKETVPYVGIVLYGSVHILKEDVWGNFSLIAYVNSGGLFGEHNSIRWTH